MLKALDDLVSPGEGGADIFPGRRHALPARDAMVWASWMVSPGVSGAPASY